MGIGSSVCGTQGNFFGLVAPKEIKHLLDSSNSSLIELREATPSTGDSVIALIAYIKEAAPKAARNANLTSLVGSTATLTTHVTSWVSAVSSHTVVGINFL